MLVPLPLVIPDDDDEEPVQEHALMRVERMDGLRVDRISIRRLMPESAEPGSDQGSDQGGRTA